MLDRYFHDAQWVRKHWDLDIDFDTDSEGDATFGKYVSSDDCLEKEESPAKASCEQQPNLDEEDERVERGAQEVREEDCAVSSEEAETLVIEQEEVLADDDVETNHNGADHEEMEELGFSDRWKLNIMIH